ncbi:MAG: ATP-binding protein [Caldilinea sp.]|nr:HAMP domain-containing protein [Caldilineaceae bacterium]MCB9123388.1 HAMP domain-containing protein [Caldilineaceae bacterium]MCO5208383.1 ATP-binding protein [Caldilinea sp.]MCW5839851.1 HAMP domain-containing protein [Caldilinea sp.]
MTIYPTRQQVTLPLRFLGGVLVTMAVALAIFWAIMQPPLEEFRAMTLFLGATAAVSVLAGYLAYRFGWISWSPRLSWTLVSSYVLSSLLTFVNVWWTARLMFINQHDLTLAIILLLFAAGIAVALGYFLSAAVTDKISALSRGADAVAHGRFQTRVSIGGRDELTRLAADFNSMAAQLEEAEARKRELEKLRRDLIAWVGHDLRTPLASVRAIVEALADGIVDDPETTARYLRTAKRDIGALAGLIDDLFDMAQMDAGGLRLERGYNAISDLISDTLESFGRSAVERGVTLSGLAAPGVDPVFCDARQISRVLANLVNNALRHTPEGGAVKLHAYPVRAGVVVEVTDTGEGIRPEDVPHIFEQFYRGEKSRSRATGGSGLGLAIVKAILEAHGVQIRVESTVGQGTRFAFVLPQRPDPYASHPLVRQRGEGRGARGEGRS